MQIKPSLIQDLAKSIPKDFTIGTATSSWQIEGDSASRGSSVWDDWAKIPGNIKDGATADPANEHIKRYKDDVPPEVKSRRLDEIVALQYRLSYENNLMDVGQTFEVLIEGNSKRSDQQWMGRNGQNKVIIFPKGSHGLSKGDYAMVRVISCTKATLHGEVADDDIVRTN